MMSGVTDLSVFQIVWPGVSTLLGAVAGGGVTLWANRQKSSYEQRASERAREQSIKDRSFNACVDFLKTARVATTAANTLANGLHDGSSNDRMVEYDKAFRDELPNVYAVSQAAQLTVPPGAQGALKDYGDAVMAFLNEVHEWKGEYFANSSSSDEANEERWEKCTGLRDDTPDRRNDFVAAVKTQFDEGVWSST